jgi:23S rRNA pseudouridine955/2504/2580 synthase
MLRKKRIKYNKKKAQGNEKLSVGDTIQLYLAEETIDQFQEVKKIKKTEKTFEVVYEDEQLLLCNKPLGLLVHPDRPDGQHTLTEEVLSYLVENGEYDPCTAKGFVPSICNRLDRNTSGIVIVGKNLGSVQEINEMIQHNRIKKFYLTLVKGVVKKQGILKGYHVKNEKTNQVKIYHSYQEGSKQVETHYNPIENNGQYTLMEIELVTGRSHQIRAHFAEIGHPLIGDSKYGDHEINGYIQKQYGLKYQFLHAYKIIFREGYNSMAYLNGQSFTAKIPSIYEQILKKEGFQKISLDNF